MLRRNKHFLPAYVFAGLIFIGSSISTRGLGKIRRMHELLEILFSEYSLHFFGFGIFAILVAWGYYKKKSSFLLMQAGLLSFCFGFIIEVYQKFLPHRDFSLVDIGVDCAGIVTALGLFWFAVKKKNLFGLIREKC
jgi:VanZ family protein